MNYKQLTLEKRYHISALQKAGLNQKCIAKELGVHPSTISRELRRNKDKIRGYNAELAQIKSTQIEMQKAKRYSITKPIEKYIRSKLKQDWSPEQIAGRMKLDTGVSVVHETIYRYIYANKKNGGKLYKYLRHKNKKYHCRSNDYKARGTIIDRVMIDKRPKIVEKKNRIGDLEIDTVIGKDHKGALVTVVDRKETYHSWERGLNEHMPERSDKCPWGTNGLIRQYLPKKSEFLNVSKDEIIMIQIRLNHRPRKVLNYKTPYEVFFSEMSKKLAS